MNDGITVLSLFDGISCGQIALERSRIAVKAYYAAEIKSIAIKCTMAHYPDTIQIGDVTKVRYAAGVLHTENGEFSVGKIDLLIGGSPCQDFSIMKYINGDALGLSGDKSKLFYEYLRLLREVNPRYFLLENVKMAKERELQLNEFLGVEGIFINSSLVSYQNRPRIYWTNIPGVEVPKDRGINFQDYIERDPKVLSAYKVNRTPSREKMWNAGNGHQRLGNCNNVTHSDKIYCITRKQDRFPNSGLIEFEDFCRYLTRSEIEGGQTLPIGYTDCLTYNQMQDVCGDGWTVDVIAHIFSYLKLHLQKKEGEKLRLITYDCEVFKDDWLVVLKDLETGRYTAVHNDNEELKQCISEDCVYVGFNSKHYDQFIIKAICCGFSPQEVKAVNDFIIGGGQGWKCPLLLTPCDIINDDELDEDEQVDSWWWRRRRPIDFRFNNVDIKDDMQMGLSLKAIEGHLGMSVEETSVSFDIDRPLTEDELKETLTYCMHDVDTTEKLVELRRVYLKSKINIGKLAGIDEVRAKRMTNAKLTAALLQAAKKPHDDERQYQYPENLKKELIPLEVYEFFDRMKNPELTDKEVFSSKIEISIGDCPVTIGYGGIHGAIPNYLWKDGDS